MKSKNERFAYFDSAMTIHELELGEFKHLQLDKIRRVSMIAGLTKTADEMKDAYQRDPNAVWAAIDFAVQAHDHYSNLIEMIETTVARLYSVTDDSQIDESMEESERRVEKIMEIISKIDKRMDS